MGDLYNDDDVARAEVPLINVGVDHYSETILLAEAVLDAVLPAYTERVLAPYRAALAELRYDFARVGQIAAQHDALDGGN